MQPLAGRHSRSLDLRLSLERLDGLPIRPISARAVLDAVPRDASGREESVATAGRSNLLDHDPGWAAFPGAFPGIEGGLARIAARSWWRAGTAEEASTIESLWRHAVATAIAARRLAEDAGRDDADDLARAGLLHQLGLWAIAAEAPALLVQLLAIRERGERRRVERAHLGREATSLGALLADRWGLGSTIATAAWLHADDRSDLEALAEDALALGLIQRAHAWAERTPWALFPAATPEPGPPDPRLRLLVAEVQVRCSGGLIDPDASPREEVLSRDHARLLIRLADRERKLESRDRLLRAIAEGDPSESPESWCDRVALSWREEPGIASAEVVWNPSKAEGTAPARLDPPHPHRGGPHVFALGRGARPAAELRIWPETSEAFGAPSHLETLLPAWSAWADVLAEKDRQSRRLHEVIAAHRSRVEEDEVRDQTSRLDALAEFAAGAGHELNNPLAVILGRAQLLIPRIAEPEATRSLRIIITQAQRAHRILRDLIYVARPPAARPRACQPDEILRASLRDLKPEAEARGVVLTSEPGDPLPLSWFDPDPMRHLIDVLVRNALEASPAGGSVRVSSRRAGDRLRWVVRDSGKGITAEEGHHLFEPFYCGRQAGRGLGMGLPRAARFVKQAGGAISWRSKPGQGTAFTVEIPFELPPDT